MNIRKRGLALLLCLVLCLGVLPGTAWSTETDATNRGVHNLEATNISQWEQYLTSYDNNPYRYQKDFPFRDYGSESELNEIGNNGLGPVVISGGQRNFQWPVPGWYNIMSCFYDYRNHCALDIAASAGTAVVASYDGVVIQAVDKGTDYYGDGFGNYVVVEHDYVTLDGIYITIYTRYSHMKKVYVGVGAYVYGGSTVLGEVGMTGAANGNHLDFQILYGGWQPYQKYSIDPYANQLLVLPENLEIWDEWPCGMEYYNLIVELYSHPLQYQFFLDVNGWLDGSSSNGIENSGTFDVYINGILVADDVGDYYSKHPEGTSYEICDVKPSDGHSYNGIHSGTRQGFLSGDTALVLDFSTIDSSGIGAPVATLAENGHIYRYYSDTVTWYTAKQFCETQGGHLAAVTSDAENTLLLNLIGNNVVWLGGTCISGFWEWVTGEPFSYGATGKAYPWNEVEPNNSPSNEGGENYLQFTGLLWNDNAGCYRCGFLFEKEVATYTITYNANGGTGAPAAQTKTQGVTLTLSSTVPTRSDYTFLGWAESQSATAAQYQPSGSFTKDANTTLYAVWKSNAISVTGVTLNKTSLTLNVGASETLTATVTPSNATNKSVTWTSSNTGVATVDSNGKVTAVSAGSATITVKTNDGGKTATCAVTVKPKTYTITYNANGGSGAPAAQTKTHGVTLTLSSEVPTRTGYNFKGWAESSSATEAQYQPGDAFTKNANTTLYAVWQIKTYTVKFNANGGSDAPAAQTKTYGKTLILSSQVPTRSGYTFLGWAESSDATEAQYQPGGNYTKNASKTLYAVWQQADGAILRVGSGSGAPGGTVKIPVGLEKNPGLAYLSFQVVYDKTRLELTGFENGGLSGWTANLSGGGFGWDDVSDSSYNGTALTLVFQIKSGAPEGNMEVKLTGVAAYNFEEATVPLAAVSGSVNVRTSIPGDVNRDQIVNGQDLIRLRKHLIGMNVEADLDAADVTGDETVDGRDLIRLRKYLIGMDVVLMEVGDADARLLGEGVLTLAVPNTALQAGETFGVPVSVSGTAAFSYLNFRVEYDKSRLKLVGYEEGALTGWTADPTGSGGFGWDDVQDATPQGTILTLRFQVLEDAQAGTASVRLSQIECFNFDEAWVNLLSETADVTISEAAGNEFLGFTRSGSNAALRVRLAGVDRTQVQVLVAAMDASGRCLGVRSGSLSATAEAGIYTASIPLPEGQAAYYRAFLVNRTNSAPLAASVDLR